ALADHHADDGHFERGHLEQVAGNGLALATLLAADARIRAGSIDEGDDGQAETLGCLHEPQCLAIALRLWHAVIAAHSLLGITPFLLTDHHDRPALEPGNAADDGHVVAEHAITVQFGEIRAQ